MRMNFHKLWFSLQTNQNKVSTSGLKFSASRFQSLSEHMIKILIFIAAKCSLTAYSVSHYFIQHEAIACRNGDFKL